MNVLVVDDHPIVAEYLFGAASKAIPDAVVRVAGDLDAALEAMRENPAELVLLDLGLPGCGGIESLLKFRKAYPEARVVVISSDDELPSIRGSLAASASGFIPKTAGPKVLVNALRLVAEGGRYVPPEALCDDGETPATRHDGRAARARSPESALTERQRESRIPEAAPFDRQRRRREGRVQHSTRGLEAAAIHRRAGGRAHDQAHVPRSEDRDARGPTDAARRTVEGDAAQLPERGTHALQGVLETGLAPCGTEEPVEAEHALDALEVRARPRRDARALGDPGERVAVDRLAERKEALGLAPPQVEVYAGVTRVRTRASGCVAELCAHLGQTREMLLAPLRELVVRGARGLAPGDGHRQRPRTRGQNHVLDGEAQLLARRAQVARRGGLQVLARGLETVARGQQLEARLECLGVDLRATPEQDLPGLALARLAVRLDEVGQSLHGRAF